MIEHVPVALTISIQHQSCAGCAMRLGSLVLNYHVCQLLPSGRCMDRVESKLTLSEWPKIPSVPSWSRLQFVGRCS